MAAITVFLQNVPKRGDTASNGDRQPDVDLDVNVH
jgi:hypothetical protein